MQSRRSILAGCLGVMTGTLAGCAGVLDSEDDDEADRPPVEAFELEIIDLREPEVGLTSATIPVLFEAHNTDSDDEITSPTLDYAIQVAGETVLESRTELATLAPGDSTVETVETVLRFDELGAAVVEAVQEESYTVTIAGEIRSEGERYEFSDQYEY